MVLLMQLDIPAVFGSIPLGDIEGLYFLIGQHLLKKPDICAKHVGKFILQCCTVRTVLICICQTVMFYFIHFFAFQNKKSFISICDIDIVVNYLAPKKNSNFHFYIFI